MCFPPPVQAIFLQILRRASRCLRAAFGWTSDALRALRAGRCFVCLRARMYFTDAACSDGTRATHLAAFQFIRLRSPLHRQITAACCVWRDLDALRALRAGRCFACLRARIYVTDSACSDGTRPVFPLR